MSKLTEADLDHNNLFMKICKICEFTKPLVDFHRNPSMRDGFLNICKSCRCEQEVARYHKIGTGKFLVYMAIFSNNKVYVGITKKGLSFRKEQHEKYALNGSDLLFHKALRKHHSVQWVVLHDEIASLDEAKYLEKFFIHKMNSKVPFGYNLTDGGDGVWGYKHSNETRRRMSLSKIGKKRPFKKRRCKPKTEEHLERCRIAVRRRLARSVVDQFGNVYESISAAEKILGVFNVGAVVNGKRSHAGNFVFKWLEK